MVQHVCNAAGIVIAVCNIPSSSPLHHLQLMSLVFLIWIQTVEQYSKFGRTSEIYAARLTSSLFIQRFLRRNPRVLFPFFTVLSIWNFHVMSCEISTPRYFVDSSQLSVWPLSK